MRKQKHAVADMVIRQGVETDADVIVDMLRRLADEIGDREKFSCKADAIRTHGFGASRQFHCLIVESQGEALGLALFFPVFSTTRGSPGVYVQDLWVAEGARGSRIGHRLLAATAIKASAEWSAAYLTLTVHGDNAGAARFYRRLGFDSNVIDCPMALDGAAFEQLRTEP